MNKLSVNLRLFLLVGLLSSVSVLVGLMGLKSMSESVSGLRTVYEDRVVPLRDLKVIADLYAVNIVDTTHKVRNGNIDWAEARKSFEQARKGITEKWTKYKGTYLVEQEIKLVKEIEPMLFSAEATLNALQVILDKEDMPAMTRFTIDTLYPVIDPISTKFSELIEVQLDVAKAEYESSRDQYESSRFTKIGLLAAGTLTGILLAFWIVGSVIRPLRQVQETAQRVSKNFDYATRIPVTQSDEVGETARAFNTLLEAQQTAIGQVNRVVQHLANGDLRQRIEGDMQGDLALMKSSINNSLDTVQRTMAGFNGLSQALLQGQFDHHIDFNNSRGEFRQSLEQASMALDVQQAVFRDITQVMQGVAEGNFAMRVTAEAKGELDTLKQSINQSMGSQQTVFQDIGHVMQGLAQGNLQNRVTAQALGDLDELKRNINQSLDALREAMTTIHHNARQVAAASGEASHAIGQISDGARHQTDAISQVSSAVRQTVSSVAEVSQNTEVASQKSRQSFTLVRGSMSKMEDMVKVVNNIASNSEKINKITEVIEKIANKTNLLSLNAAIEAARAGEHGKGFAVVADEVGKLALNSAQSSQEIAVLVKQAVEEARSAVTAVMDVSQDMSSIERETQATDQMLQRISTALEEQSSAVDQINQNLNNLDQIARSNSAASEEIAATVVELSKIADATRREVQRFQT